MHNPVGRPPCTSHASVPHAELARRPGMHDLPTHPPMHYLPTRHLLIAGKCCELGPSPCKHQPPIHMRTFSSCMIFCAFASLSLRSMSISCCMVMMSTPPCCFCMDTIRRASCAQQRQPGPQQACYTPSKLQACLWGMWSDSAATRQHALALALRTCRDTEDEEIEKTPSTTQAALKHTCRIFSRSSQKRRISPAWGRMAPRRVHACKMSKPDRSHKSIACSRAAVVCPSSATAALGRPCCSHSFCCRAV